jgi:hypothetical protein
VQLIKKTFPYYRSRSEDREPTLCGVPLLASRLLLGLWWPWPPSLGLATPGSDTCYNRPQVLTSYIWLRPDQSYLLLLSGSSRYLLHQAKGTYIRYLAQIPVTPGHRYLLQIPGTDTCYTRPMVLTSNIWIRSCYTRSKVFTSDTWLRYLLLQARGTFFRFLAKILAATCHRYLLQIPS